MSVVKISFLNTVIEEISNEGSKEMFPGLKTIKMPGNELVLINKYGVECRLTKSFGGNNIISFFHVDGGELSIKGVAMPEIDAIKIASEFLPLCENAKKFASGF